MSEKPTYEELEQRIRELESNAADLTFTTTIPIEGDQIFKHCFENASVGVCLVEPDGDFIKVNSRMVEIFGYSKQEFEDMNVADVSHPEDIAISLDVQRKVKVGKIESTVFQKRYIHKKGQWNPSAPLQGVLPMILTIFYHRSLVLQSFPLTRLKKTLHLRITCRRFIQQENEQSSL